jgi:phage antirepressor YoqD-like protein
VNGAIYKGEEVFTIGQVCEMLGKDKDTVKAYVKNHKSVFVEDVDYFRLSKADVLDLRERLAGTEVYRFYATSPNNVRAYTHIGVEKLARIYKRPNPFGGASENCDLEIETLPAIEPVTWETDEVVEWQGHRVLTTNRLAAAYGCSVENIHKNFSRNKEQFREGTDYFVVTREGYLSICQVHIPPSVTKLYLWTESGAFLHGKSLNTPEAWDLYRRLLDTYFRVAESYIPSYTIDDEIQRALAWAQEKKAAREALAKKDALIEAQVKELEAAKPKVEFADAVLNAINDIYIGDMAKLLHKNGVVIGRNNLFKKLREQGYITNYGGSQNMPTQYAVNNGWLRVKETVWTNPKTGENNTGFTTMVTGKGQAYFLKKFMANGGDVYEQD